MLIDWKQIKRGEGFAFTSPDIEGYEIVTRDLHSGYFVRRLVAECDDIGPLDEFQQAEDIVMKINICLTHYEEGLWKVMAAQAIKASQASGEAGAPA